MIVRDITCGFDDMKTIIIIIIIIKQVLLSN